ncbi:NAD(P)/FAD-dependent oxidoreductase [Neolewinella lacunae]|uniref:NAD(P)/FAD-dependent oxidoreductase n=1 Tax=Neolewinella lacunae TaxID=1517758 RepID=A0A923PK42_9BACT|nr:NAD(P)/FAD-dependent oxidoreductase [Neolewinella lacunae]MBC6995603.1 NAD(P)/FAD-dependent oxidoreductase [Neolewinella lacunae]MDN3635639.1 NAD(P)/FAD-dependent oxidoreductase [Neolewinella lacunae]
MPSPYQPTNIAIIGAGPAGAATALRLSYLGIPCVLIDKAGFPRDKICGDALSGKVPTLLNRLDPAIMDRFRQRFRPVDVWGIRFYPPSKKLIELPFKVGYERIPDEAPGYVAKRLDFDAFLIEEVRRRPNIELHLNTEISSYEKTPTGYRIQAKDGGPAWECRLLIDASGAHSRFSRKEAGQEVDHDHYAAAVRAYYRGVTGFHPDNFIELHFLEKYNPGYFWIFPLPGGQANVGLGMRSDIVKKKKINLREALDEIIASPDFAPRFANAEQIDPTAGYGLPLGSKERTLSGDNYLLTGDAGHLIDPLTGEGIGNATYSGFIAAELAEKCLAENRFDAAFLAAYDVRIARVLRTELRLSYRMQQIMQIKWLTNLLTGIVAANPKVIEVLCRMYTDFELRKQIVKPLFWWKLFRAKTGKMPLPETVEAER